MEEFEYESLNQKDSPIKLSRRETNYKLFLLGGIHQANAHPDDKDTVVSILNNLEWSNGKG